MVFGFRFSRMLFRKFHSIKVSGALGMLLSMSMASTQAHASAIDASKAALWSPVANESFVLGARVHVRVATPHLSRPLTKVRVLVDGTAFDSSSACPCEYSWTASTTGKHILTAEVSDAFNTWQSEPLEITVSGNGTQTFLASPSTAPAALAAIAPAGFVEAQLATGFDRPTQMQISPDGRIFILQQGGSIRIYKNGALLTTPFLTLGNVFSTQDYGLLGIAFDPAFTTNNFIYLFYGVSGTPKYTRISRVTAAGDVMQAGSETLIFKLDDFTGQTHQGGALHFGNDGKLYIFTGTPNENTSLAQSFTSTFGKVLRINSDGTIPADNPFLGSTTGRYQAIYARGLRNPFTASVQATTGRIFINDNGQDAWEEINEVVSGVNYGWPATEGNTGTPPANYRGPFFTYPHVGQAGNSGSIVAAAFYNPATAQFPAPYIGKYFYADHVLGEIRYVDPTATTPSATAFATGLNLPLDIKIGADGTLYYLTRGNSSLYSIRYTANLAPQINQNPVNLIVPVGEAGVFCASVSGTAPLAYQWQKNNVNVPGATGSCYTTPASILGDNGTLFRIVATNPWGTATSANATLSVTSNRRPTATIMTPMSGSRYNAGGTLAYSGSGNDPDEGALGPSQFTWWINFHHNEHSHTTVPATSGSTSGSHLISTNDEKNDDVFLRVHLRVVDAQGLADEDSVDVQPNKATLTLASSPAGIALSLDNASKATPHAWVGVVGTEWNLSAPLTAIVGSTAYRFSAWSNGQAAAHTLYGPATNTTYTATYVVDNTRGTILRQVWNGIAGTTVAALTGNANFPNSPSASSSLTSFEGPTNAGDSYGSRIVGLLYPPTTGAYTFWIAGDDNVELWLSTTALPANKVKIAFHNDWNTPRQWTKVATQQSAAIALTAGQKYHIEAIHKEGTGGDNLAVAWQGPGIAQQVIPGAYLSNPEALGPVPAPWISADIGGPGLAGSAGYAGGLFSVTGGGTDIWSTADAFRFVYQPLTGDGEIKARVETVQNADPYAKAGIMMREGLAANAINVMAAVGITQGAAIQYRTALGGTTVNVIAGNLAPYWVRLVRAGNLFTAYRSPDGATWTQIGQTTLTVGASMQVGLAVTAHNNAALNTSVFSNVTVSGSSQVPVITQQPSNVSVSVGSTGTFSVTATGSPVPTYQWRKNGVNIAGAVSATYITPVTTVADNASLFSVVVTNSQGMATSNNATLTVTATTLPLPWANADIGGPGQAGSTTFASGIFTVKGGGTDIWGAVDAFQFVYQSLTGDGEIKARIETVQNTDPYAKAGVMMRDGLGANAINIMAAVAPTQGASVQYRTATGGTTANAVAGNLAPYWVKLVRSGNQFTAYRSPDGATWTAMGQTTLTMGATLQVGLAVTAHNNAVLNTSTVSNVTVSAAKVFSEADVGSVGFAGSHSISNGIHTVRGSGADIVGTVDAFHFSYVTLNGDGQIQVRVTAIQNTNAWAKAGIMFRNGLAANAQHASLLLSYANGVLFERRLTTAGATAETITGGVPVPYWLRMVRAGNLFTAYRSADGITWTLVGSATVAMPSSILVGMAVTSVNNAQLATDTFNYVSVP